jgi:hypothetical protein
MSSQQRFILVILVPLTAILIGLFAASFVHPALVAPDDLRLTDSLYIANPDAEWLALVALVPLAIAIAFAWRWERPVTDYFQPELIGTYSNWITLANGYAFLYIIRVANFLPNLDPAPRTFNDSRLLALPVNWLIIVAPILSTLFFLWFLFLRPQGFGRLADRIALPHRRIALLLLLGILSLSVWVLGGVYFSIIMVLPTWLWILIEPTASPTRKVINLVLALVGGLPFLAPLFFIPAGATVWSFITGLTYFVVFPLDVLLYVLAVSLFIRFLRLAVAKPYIAPLPPEDPLFHLIKSQ